MRYTITYDLNAPETANDYKKLIKALTDLGAKKLQYSQWILRTNSTAVALRDYLWTFMDGNDRLLVQSLDDNGWASMRMITNPNDV